MIIPDSQKTEYKKNIRIKKGFAENHLDVRDYLGDGFFLLKNLDFGTFFEIEGIIDETLTLNQLNERLRTLEQSIRDIILGVPNHLDLKNIIIQFHCSQREVHKNVEMEKDDCQITKILREEEQFLYDSSVVLERKHYISIRLSNKSEKGLFRSLIDEASHYVKSYKELENKSIGNIFKSLKEKRGGTFVNDLMKNLNNFKKEIKNFKSYLSVDFKIKELSNDDYIKYVQNILNGFEDKDTYSDTINIHQQVESCIAQDNEKEAILSDGRNLKVFYVRRLPAHYKNGLVRVLLQSLPINNWDFVVNLSSGQGQYGQDLVALEGWFGRKTNANKENAALTSFRDNTASDRPYCDISLRLITDVQDDEENQIISTFQNYLGVKLSKETQIFPHMLVTSLPMNCTSLANNRRARFKRVRLENAISLLPIYKGNDVVEGRRKWLSRDNSMTAFDLFAGEGNKMTSFLAPTRAGKSVFNANLILDFLSKNPNGIVRVIDKKTSYFKLSDLIGGRVISFSEESLRNTPYSPFALDSWSLDDIDNIYVLISTVLVQKNKNINLSACHSEVLREAIKLAFNSHLKRLDSFKNENIEIDPHPIWNDILSEMPNAVENLKSSGVKGVEAAKDDLCNWSVNLYETGQYSFIFSRHEKMTIDSSKERFLAYDLDGISDPILRQISAMMAFIKIGRDLAKIELTTPKLVIFEEFGMLIHGDDEAQKLINEFTLNVIKTCAKLNAQGIFIDNTVETFSEKEAGKTAWQSSSQKIFLPPADLYEPIRKAWPKELNEADFQILKSLKKEFHYKRSQAYIRSNNEVLPYYGSIFVNLSPFMDALTTTSPRQVNLYKELKKEGYETVEALEHMANDCPYGRAK